MNFRVRATADVEHLSSVHYRIQFLFHKNCIARVVQPVKSCRAIGSEFLAHGNMIILAATQESDVSQYIAARMLVDEALR